ncbi:hypothetical protein ElyMa_006703400 [Elysia marginata]|uniref:G-protein coupled receptors family 1 profile domain-containing protein n=1 Tax=Elysia marginata TaxID=1093978 RepID=A0AAV4IUG0_9GAST|nr:hypothetical protein ElyMa_006703400 [Elysia marginata]
MDNFTNSSTFADAGNAFYSSSHNIWFGISGFITNGLSVTVILLCKGLRHHQKISMLSLVFNDLVFMASVTIYGVLPVVSQLKLARKLCWPLVYTTLATHTVTFMTISHMTFTSYLAVFKPFRFRSRTSKRRTLIEVVCIWLASWLFVLACIRFDLTTKGKGCSFYLFVSGVGWVTWVTVPILCACLVTVVNLKILLYLHIRKKSKVAPHELVWNSNLPRLRELDNVAAEEVLKPQHLSHSQRIRPPCSIEQGMMDETPRLVRSQGHKPHINNLTRSGDDSKSSFQSVETLKVPNYRPTLSHLKKTPAGVSGIQKERLLERCSQTTDLEQLRVPKQNEMFEIEKKICEGSQGNPRANNAVSADSNTIYRQRHSDRNKRKSNQRLHKATITLAILTLSSCLLCLPEVVFCLVLAVRPEDREDILTSNIAKFAKLCVGINVLMNPALYCWRLINWGNLRRYAVSKWRGLRPN